MRMPTVTARDAMLFGVNLEPALVRMAFQSIGSRGRVSHCLLHSNWRIAAVQIGEMRSFIVVSRVRIYLR
jgi:hypothetical protein